MKLRIKARPGSSCQKILPAGPFEGADFVVCLKSPAIEGKANRELVSYLAESLGLKSGDISIISGAGGRKKIIEVKGDEIIEKLRGLQGKGP